MKKRSIAFILVAIVAVGGMSYVVWRRVTRTPQAFFERGKKYYEENKYREAMIELLNAVRREPRNRDARLLLARTYLKLQDLGDAAGQLKAVLEYFPDDVDANLELGNIELLAGQRQPELYARAQEQAKKVLAKDPNNVPALILSGNASAGQKDFAVSVDTLEKATALDPKNSAAFVSLGISEALQKNNADAEKAFLKAREANPNDKNALISLANYYRLTEAPAKAESTFKDALAQNPADRQVFLQAADFYLRNGRFEDAEKVLQNAQEKSSTDPFPSMVLVNLYETGNRGVDARKLLLDLKTKFPRNLEVSARLAANLIPDQPERARIEIDQITKAEPKSPVGYVLLGEYQYRLAQFDAAEATLGKDPALNSPFPQVHFLLGALARRKGQLDPSIDHFQKALKINAAFVPARLALAESFITKGRPADAREEIQRILKIDPKNGSARLMKSSLDFADKKFPEAETELVNLQKEHPNSPAVERQLGLYYESRGKTTDAEKNFTKELELAPDSEQGLRDLVLFYLRAKQTDRAGQKLAAIPDAQRQAFHYELIGMVAAQSGKLPDAEDAYKKALQKEPGRGTTQQLLFDQYVRTKRFDEAIHMVDDQIKKDPANPGALAMRGNLYDLQGKSTEAKQNYEQALQNDPNQFLAANNLAYLLADQGKDLDTALKYAQVARNKRPEDPSIADTLGWVYYKLNRPVLAKDSAQFALSKQPDNPVYQYHLGMIYKSANQRSEAETVLKKAVANPVAFKEKSDAEEALKDIDHWRHLTGSRK